MPSSKPSANVFGTFLDSVSSSPSRSKIDLDRITKQAIGWSTRQQEMNAPESTQNAGSGAIVAILKSIDAAKKPLSIISIVKATNLGIDPAAAAIRDAVTTGLVSSHTQPDGVEFDLMAAGRSLI